MDKIPFVYHNLDRFAHKILYYETSRGCPFRCSYCLSSIDKRVRLRSLSLVFPELQFFLDHKVDQVKFVDRTFNCNHEHAYEIWKYLLEHDNGITNFHFEVAADLLREEDFALFAQMRKGLIQLEIGIQSTYPDTITEIRRVMDVGKVAECVARVKRCIIFINIWILLQGCRLRHLHSFSRALMMYMQCARISCSLVFEGAQGFLYGRKERGLRDHFDQRATL